jgi:glutamine cyclotransferase
MPVVPLRPSASLLALAFVLCSCGGSGHPAGYEVVHTFPHDPGAFTEGLFYRDGFLYESTGLEGHSSIRKVRLETGEILQHRDLANLTWRGQSGFVYDLATFEPWGNFSYTGEGWALTQDGRQIIMSDGTSRLRFLDPATLRETGRLDVTSEGRPLPNLNELEWVKGQIFANVWHQDRIARIDPASGKVVGWIDLTGLWAGSDHDVKTLNGIAYDAEHDRLFVTGKNWPSVFEIRPR